MSEDYTQLSQIELEAEMMRLNRLTEKATLEMRRRGMAAALARTEFKVEFAKARLGASGKTVNERDDHATVVCASLLKEHELTQALYESAKEASRNYRSQLDIVRSINSNLRALVTGG